MAQIEAEPYDRIKAMREYKSPYERWKEIQGIPTIRGYFVKDLRESSSRRGRLVAGRDSSSTSRGPAGSTTRTSTSWLPRSRRYPSRHIYEDSVFILTGQGATTVWIDENKKQTFEWHERRATSRFLRTLGSSTSTSRGPDLHVSTE